MIKNYFKIALRALNKNKVFAGINIMGLAIGISASLVIYLLVNYHFTFDQFEENKERIYRVNSNFSFSGEIYHNAGVFDPLAPAVKASLTGLDAVAPIRTMDGDALVSVPVSGQSAPVIFKHQKGIVFADSNFLNMVGYKWLAGSSKTAFNEPYQAVLTASNAKLYFPNESPTNIIGKYFFIDDSIRAVVSGVVKDIDANTDFTFKTFIAYQTLEKTTLKPENWNSWNSTTGSQQLFIKLAAGVQPGQVEKQIAALYKRNYTNEPGDKSKTWHTLQPLSDLHFNSDYGIYDSATAHKPTLYGLLAVASFLLLLGCINFINLTTAHATQRAKEIGIRKTMGSSRGQLVIQFLNETLLLTFTATLLSIILTPLILKAFAGFIPEGLRFDLFGNPAVIAFLMLLMLVVTLLAGFYPALVLSGFKPVTVLKNQAYSSTNKTRSSWLRKSLTVSQFVIAQLFIMAAILVSKQITFSINKDLGFKKDALVYLQTNFYDTVKNNKYVLIDKLKSIPGIEGISLSTAPPSSNNTWSSTMKFKDGKQEIEADVQQKYADSNYIKLFKIKLLAGDNLRASDTVTSFLINETFARVLGFKKPSDAVGKMIEWSDKPYPIVGVVADFHQKSLREQIKPLVIGSWQSNERTINIALQPNADAGTWKTTIAKIEQAWKQVYPKDDFEYHFFDKEIEKYYESEQHIASLLKWATGLAVFISCLGLLGLVIYTTNQRTKEIGVRKVLGASVSQIVQLITKDFILLVLLAFIIAVPIAWLAMNQWLQNFAYRTGISWWIFGLAGVTMILIALFTLAAQTIKAAVANPVKSLRTE